MTFDMYKSRADVVRARAEKIRDMILERAREAARAAGLDPRIMGIHVHNALVDRDYGKPWSGVDYSLARRARWLMGKAHEPIRLSESIRQRWISEVQWGQHAA